MHIAYVEDLQQPLDFDNRLEALRSELHNLIQEETVRNYHDGLRAMITALNTLGAQANELLRGSEE